MSLKNGRFIKCARCGKEKYFNLYRITRGAKYCSSECTKHRVTKNCLVCKKEFWVIKSHERVGCCSYVCSNKLRKITTKCRHNSGWVGGRYKDKSGYILIYFPNHPYCDGRNSFREHRYVAECYFDRFLSPEEIIHHIDDDKSNNLPNNLYLFASNSEHQRYHFLVKNNKISPITESNLPM